MRLPFALTSHKREKGGLPELPVVNMYAEAAPSEEGGVVLQSRPGFDDRGASMGSGPVEQLFKGDGVLGSELYGVSAGHLWRETTDLGAIDGTGPVSMAGFQDMLFVCAGESVWVYDGTTLSAVAFPDGANVTKIVVGASRLIAIRADTEQLYWSDVLTDTIDALSFSSAESQPDRLRDMLFIDDMVILFGAETVEFHPNTGDPDLPFQPLEGRVFERGIRATGCATSIGTTFAWVTNQNQVCLGDQENVISDAGLEAEIAASNECRVFSCFVESSEALVIRLDTVSHVFMPRAKTWHLFETYGETNWMAQCYAGGAFGSALDGRTMAFGDGYTDIVGVMERRFRAGQPINAGGLPINNIMLRCNTGQTTYLTGDYADPTVEMRLSRDGGRTWASWRQTKLGTQGSYRDRVQWLGCGMASRRGLFAEFRVTDPVDWAVSDVLVNEPYGGV